MSPEMRMRWQCLDLAAKFTVGIGETITAAARFEQFVHRGIAHPAPALAASDVARGYPTGVHVWGPYTKLHEHRSKGAGR